MVKLSTEFFFRREIVFNRLGQVFFKKCFFDKFRRKYYRGLN